MIEGTGSIPFQVARAYGVTPRPVQRVTGVAPMETVGQAPLFSPLGGSKANPGVARLVAGTVPGRVDFSGDVPQPGRASLSLYRHPADRNAAATGVQAGRVLDVNG